MKASFPFRKKILKILIYNLKLFPEDQKKFVLKIFPYKLISNLSNLSIAKTHSSAYPPFISTGPTDLCQFLASTCLCVAEYEWIESETFNFFILLSIGLLQILIVEKDSKSTRQMTRVLI